MFKLYDYVNIAPDEKISSLKKEEKNQLADSIFKSKKQKKGLFITYDLSHSGRRINNRIYGTKGQQNGALSVMSPYAKPILQHHDKTKDPIGRFVSAEWEDLSQEAIKFFSNINDFMEVKAAYDSDDTKAIYSAMKKYNLLTNKDWPGMGRIRVKAQITDKEAIEKFLDGRYITFSAGSTTDRHTCSICDSDWAKGDFCEHKHGKIYDGEVCVFITGDFNVLEGSVVNMPADDLSQLQSMEFIQDAQNIKLENVDFKTNKEGIMISDALYTLEDYSMEDDKEEILEEIKETVENDKDDTVEEVSSEDKIIEKIYNKILEKYSEVFERLAKDEKEKEKTEPEKASEQLQAEDEEIKQEEEGEASDGTSVRGLPAALQNETTSEEKMIGDTDGDITKIIAEEIATIKNKKLEDTSVDWYLLDAALTVELEDKALTAEQRKDLPDSAFCGPERSFPVNDCAHVTAAKRLLNRAKLSDSQKAKVLSCVNEKAESMKCDASKDETFSKEINDLKEEIKSLREALASKNDNKEIEQKDEVVIENPSIISSDESSATENSNMVKLGSYEKKFIKEYNEILNRDGEIIANDFFILKSRYLKKGFDPKKYIN